MSKNTCNIPFLSKIWLRAYNVGGISCNIIIFIKGWKYRKLKESNGGSIINANVDVVDDVIIVVK